MGRTRRAVLASTAALAGATGGCTGLLGGEGTPPTDTSTDAPTGTPGPDRLTLEPTEPPLATDGAEPERVVVYPDSMGLWLRRAAKVEGTYRGHARAFVENPEPFWTGYGTVELTGRDAAGSEGTYTMTATGGTRYRILVGATRVTDAPADATPVASLSPERRELARGAIAGERVGVHPETELGEWVRTAWFGGHYEHEGAVYRGREVRQTDAAFFSEEVWATVELTPTRADPEVTFVLSGPGAAVTGALDPLLAERPPDGSAVIFEEPPAALLEYLDGVDLLATHTTVFEPRYF